MWIVCLFFRERFLQWKNNQLVLGRKTNYDDDVGFLDDYYKSDASFHNRMCEYYLHGFLLGHFSQSFFNIFVGEVQIRALVSLLQNQVEWEDRLNQYREAHSKLGLPMRDETPRSMAFRNKFT